MNLLLWISDNLPRGATIYESTAEYIRLKLGCYSIYADSGSVVFNTEESSASVGYRTFEELQAMVEFAQRIEEQRNGK